MGISFLLNFAGISLKRRLTENSLYFSKNLMAQRREQGKEYAAGRVKKRKEVESVHLAC
ncbi:hypothetical protein HX109_15570 [Galbibacter sp. BG1]|uniref:hypothetical protein n=1 Tax=Galbibacter sp. BG1 TaxID=1170699 RepID=UPI0015C0EAAE|nr:hypothetical protein [Galbibacter sp. BG1]QLE02918.1 hypothetical protein HX109_15570 [Galbibacter sp. BG1]